MRVYAHIGLWLLLLTAPMLHAAPSAAEQKALQALKGKNFNARINALGLLKQSRDAAVVSAVIATLQDSDATVRWAAADALESMGSATAVPALKTASNDPSPLVAGRARTAWATLTRGKGTAPAERKVKISATDVSRSGERGLDTLMLTTVKAAYAEKRAAMTTDDSTPSSYTAVYNVQTLKETPAAGGKALEVACTATVSEQPSGALRFATRVVAGVDLPAGSTAADRKDSIEEALKAAGGGLAQETLDWLARAP